MESLQEQNLFCDAAIAESTGYVTAPLVYVDSLLVYTLV
jgi:hypothetical protein